MSEKRKCRRSDFRVSMRVHCVVGEANEIFDIELQNISREGIGFFSNSFIEVQEFYDTDLYVDQEVIKTVIKIVHCHRLPTGGFIYGAEFVGMPEQDRFRIDVYQIVHD